MTLTQISQTGQQAWMLDVLQNHETESFFEGLSFLCSMLVARLTVPFPFFIVSEMIVPFSFFLQNKNGANSVLNNIEGKVTWLMYNKFPLEILLSKYWVTLFTFCLRKLCCIWVVHSTSSQEHATHNLTETMYAYYVEGRILILQLAIKFSNSTFIQERLLDDGMSPASDFKSGSAFIQGFFHIRATAYVWMCTSLMCIKTQYWYDTFT